MLSSTATKNKENIVNVTENFGDSLSTAAGGEAKAVPGRREAGEGDGGDRGQRPGQAGPPGQSEGEEFR